MIIVHVSDVHFGRPHRPGARAGVDRFVQETGPDLVVVSGDLTQRAKVNEFQEAKAFLDGLSPFPVVTTPGNHDVPLYRFWERILFPYRNYREHIAQSLDTVVDVGTARIVALNTAAPRTQIVNGRLSGKQLDFARSHFRGAPEGFDRVLVMHHHMLGPGDLEPDVPLPGRGRVLRGCHEWGVDLVLSGHLHRSYVKTTAEGLPGHSVSAGIPIVHAGTTTSSRGRGKEAGRNSLNVIRVEDRGIEISVYLYSEEVGRFLPDVTHRYPRRSR